MHIGQARRDYYLCTFVTALKTTDIIYKSVEIMYSVFCVVVCLFVCMVFVPVFILAPDNKTCLGFSML